jgi:hypothetical protein
VIHITRSNLIVMSAYADPGRWIADDLPLYAAPLDRGATMRWSPTDRRTTLVDTWVPYGRIVAREHPWIDRGERAFNELRVLCRRYEVRVTDTNAPISLRVALPADELAAALATVAERGAIEIGGCALALDPRSRHAGDESTITVLDGSMSMPWMYGRLPVSAAARPWSSTRADLVITPVKVHRVRYPRRWFSVGFALADELRLRVTRPTG